jgi:hypothetical protein
MKTRMQSPVAAVLAFLLAWFAGEAQAGIFRAYLSITGSDANPCTIQAPCRLLPAALAAANDGGEIWMLDSANFNTGPVVINKAIKVLAIPGEMGSVVGNGGDALIINAPGKDVTLRNLTILNLAGGMSAVNIVDAAAVHIEKTTIHEFTDPNSSCIFLPATTTVRLYIDETYLRRCRTAIHVSAFSNLVNRPSIIVDNTRIERGAATSGPVVGVWLSGCADLTLRNTLISRHDIGILADSFVGGCGSHLRMTDSELTRNTTGLEVDSASPGASLEVAILGSQVGLGTDAIVVNNSSNTTSVILSLTDSQVSYCGNNCITLNNLATDDVQGIQLQVARSHIGNTSNNALDLSAPNGSRVRVTMRDSTLTNATGRLVRTTGAGPSAVQVSLVHTTLNSALYGIDHGYGQVRLDGCHITNLTNTFVNNGSADIKSLGNNWLSNFQNTSGFVYITPAIIAPI